MLDAKKSHFCSIRIVLCKKHLFITMFNTAGGVMIFDSRHDENK